MTDRHSSYAFFKTHSGRTVYILVATCLYLGGFANASHAQQPAPSAAPSFAEKTTPSQSPALSGGQSNNWSTAVQTPAPAPQIGQPSAGQSNAPAVAIKLVALLTDEGPQIEEGLIWRIYKFDANALNSIIAIRPKLISKHKLATPAVRLSPGSYAINAAFGLANLTRKITVKPGTDAVENFVLNAGGLRLKAMLSDGAAPVAGAIRYDIFSDQRNQFGERTRIVSGIKPNIVVRLNAGLYYINSIYGDANSRVSSDVAVEAGKLTEVALTHTASRVTLKLVTRSGGEALADARWKLETSKGIAVLKTVGAIPSYILAAGSYVVTVRYGADVLKRAFTVAAGQDINVEVIMP